MCPLKPVVTDAAPAAIGPYSQAVKAGKTLYISGQIPLHPETMLLVEGGIREQAIRAFENLRAIAEADGASLQQVVKVNLSVLDMDDFAEVNAVMETFFKQPYPARACVQVSALPKGAAIEIEAIAVLD